MKKIIAIVLGLSVLAACGDDEIDGGTKASKSGGAPGNFYEVEVNGLDCILWMDKHGAGDTSWAYSGLDCDWGPR